MVYIIQMIFFEKSTILRIFPKQRIFLKATCSTTLNRICRFALKTGSVLFLLFFTLISPLAPLAAQVGSALFILLVMVLAPFMKSAPPVENAIPDHSPAPIVQTAELDSVVTEFTLYNEIPDIALRSNQRQQPNTSVAICDVCLKIPLPIDSLQGKYHSDFILNYPAEYLANSQPSRAAPYLI